MFLNEVCSWRRKQTFNVVNTVWYVLLRIVFLEMLFFFFLFPTEVSGRGQMEVRNSSYQLQKGTTKVLQGINSKYKML
jgi:hypothetical protein